MQLKEAGFPLKPLDRIFAPPLPFPYYFPILEELIEVTHGLHPVQLTPA